MRQDLTANLLRLGSIACLFCRCQRRGSAVNPCQQSALGVIESLRFTKPDVELACSLGAALRDAVETTADVLHQIANKHDVLLGSRV